MFEDQRPNSSTGQGSGGTPPLSPSRPTPGVAPASLESMPQRLQPVAPVAPPNLPIPDRGMEMGKGSVGPEPEDILESIDGSTPLDRQLPPKQPPMFDSSRSMPAAPAVPPRQKPESQEPFFKRHRRGLLLTVIVVLGTGVLGVGGWYAYNTFLVPSEAPILPAGNLNVNTNSPAVPINSNQPAVGQNQNIPVVPITPPETIDSDLDGVTDDEEAMYGSDPQKVDTDGDGLTDRDETKVFKTDPTNPDTDGDGFNDYEEVRNGYDPKGEGRLLRIE